MRQLGRRPLCQTCWTEGPEVDRGNLGQAQRKALQALREHGDWFPGCGWSIPAITEKRTMEGLVRRGLIMREGDRYSLLVPV